MLSGLRSRVARLFRHARNDREIDAELRYHLDEQIEANVAAGMATDEARRQAMLAFGGVEKVREECRDVRPFKLLEDFAQDVRYGVRQLRRSPGFTIVAVLTLALGIGANTGIFSLMDALLLRLLPVHDPSNLVQLMLIERGQRGDSFSYPAVRALAARTDAFSGLCGFTPAVFAVGVGSDTERVDGALVAAAFYETLGLVPAAGRLLRREDDERGATPAAVISYRYWRRAFEEDGRGAHAISQSIGRTLVINGKPVMIVGVSPPAFTGANVGEAADITLPLAALTYLNAENARLLDAGAQWLRVLARPRPGLSREQLKARLDVVWPQINSAAVSATMSATRRDVLLGSALDTAPGGTGWSRFGNQFRRPLLALMAMVGVVLLIACANVANLLLARGSARSKEIAVRITIGASARRVVRQLVTESVLLSTLGAALGLLFAYFGSQSLVQLISSGRPNPIVLDLQPDLRILGFTAAVALVTALLFGMAPAFRATSVGAGAALKDARGITRSRSRLARGLVISQIALSLMMLIGAGLFVRTLRNLEALDPGFRPEGVLLMTFDARGGGLRESALASFYQELLARFERLTGVKSASLSGNTPLSGGIWSGPVTVSGLQTPTEQSVHFNNVAPRFFETLGMPLLIGRDFTLRDQPGAPPVAIVNQAFVRSYFPVRRVLGERVHANSIGMDVEIVGVVEDAVSFTLREPAPPAVYIPYFQHPKRMGYTTFEVYAEGSLSNVALLMRDEVRTLLPELTRQVQVQTLTEQVHRSLVQERLLATLAGAFGVLASLLAGIGLYGLLGYMVTRRSSEIGIRVALGARRFDVLWMVLRDAIALVVVGVFIGVPCAFAATRLIRGFLFGLGPDDPLTIASAVAMLLATALLAALLPARRAAKVDPIVALRCE